MQSFRFCSGYAQRLQNSCLAHHALQIYGAECGNHGAESC